MSMDEVHEIMGEAKTNCWPGYETLAIKEEPNIATTPSPRTTLLEVADSLVNGDRNANYGEPSQDFDRTAKLWNVYLLGVLQRKAHESGQELPHWVEDLMSVLTENHDVAWMQTMIKVSRAINSPQKMDHYADVAGYAACGYDCIVNSNREVI